MTTGGKLHAVIKEAGKNCREGSIELASGDRVTVSGGAGAAVVSMSGNGTARVTISGNTVSASVSSKG